MATLAAAFHERKESMNAEVGKRQGGKFRLIADPYISVEQIQGTLESYTRFHKCSDLWRLICPPPAMSACTWQSPPNSEWMAKCCGLVFEMLAICPNTKLASTKVKKALSSMHCNKALYLSPNLGKAEDALDKLDLTMRILLNMFREVKVKDSLRDKIFRNLSKDEKIKMQMVLEKVVLPKECYGVDTMDSQETSEDTSAQCLALVAVPAEHEAKPCEPLMPPKPTLKRSLCFSSSSLSGLTEMPSIFQKIMQEDELPTLPTSSVAAAAPKSRGADLSDPKSQGADLSDHSVLQAALGHQAPQLQGKKGQKKTKKKQQIGSKAVAKAKAVSKPKAKAKAKQAKKKTSKTPGRNPQPENVETTDYVIETMPSITDGYRNLYVSRHYHQAYKYALKHGHSEEAAKGKGRVAGQQAGKIWDEYHPE